MDFETLRQKLLSIGYSDDTADAKIAHDIVLKAVWDAGFHDHLTIKGGVVMSGLTDVVRRATMDMDVDFLHYSLANESIRKFVSRLSRVAPCKISIKGRIILLKQQEYKGKRVDPKMRENTVNDVCRRLARIFADEDYMKGLSNPASAWLDVDPVLAANGIVRRIKGLENATAL